MKIGFYVNPFTGQIVQVHTGYGNKYYFYIEAGKRSYKGYKRTIAFLMQGWEYLGK